MTPTPPVATQPSTAESDLPLGSEPVSVSMEQMPLPTFINALLGDALKLDFTIDPRVAQRGDIVTMRTAGPRTPHELLALGRQVLANYDVKMFWRAHVMHVVMADSPDTDIPEIIRSRSLPEVSSNLRPIFQYYQVANVPVNDLMTLLTATLGNRVHLTPVPTTNAVVLVGTGDDVRSAIEMLQVLDQPRMSGRRSLRIEPVYWTAAALADKLTEILRAQGYQVGSATPTTTANAPASSTAITILAVPPVNAVVAFALDDSVLALIEQWARDLDRPAHVDPNRRIFVYNVRNTTAESLGAIVSGVLTGITSSATAGGAQAKAPDAGGAVTAGASPTAAAATASAASAASVATPSRFIVDSARNALVFLGSAEDYAEVRPLLENLDRTPKEALIEATVIEVGLNDETQLGVEWSLALGLGGQYAAKASTLGDLGTPSTSGLNVTILNNGSEKALLHALTTHNPTSVLSTPRLLARSGTEAKITVGAQVPVLSSEYSNGTSSGTGTSILQSIQYVNTGVILTVKPVVQGADRIDLEISQEVSQAETTTTSSISSPTISKREVKTQLSLKDGSTVLLGGMISNTVGNSETGVPGLMDIPYLGSLFRYQDITHKKTELLVFITPYIIQDGDDADRITKVFRDRIGSLAVPNKDLKW